MNLMTQQIKPTQIIPEVFRRPNPNIATPRDLKPLQGTNQSELITPSFITEDGVFEERNVGNSDLETVIPQTPVILSIKSQTVGFQPDGTSKVDVVLEVQNVDYAVEYEIRVGKVAGNI